MDKLYLGIKGHVVCLAKSNGELIWKQKLKNSTLTNVYYESDMVYAFAGGHLFALDAKNGEIKWENTLSGLGYGPCIIASESQNTALVANQVAAQQAAQAAAVATTVATTAAATSN